MNTDKTRTARIIKSERLANFLLAESVYLPNSEMSRHPHELAHVCVILSGSYTEIYGGIHLRSRFAKPSQLVLLPPGESHSITVHGKGARIFTIKFNPVWLDACSKRSIIFARPLNSVGGPALTSATQIYREFRRMDEFSELEIEGLALEIIAKISRGAKLKGQKHPSWLVKAKKILDDQFPQRIEISDVAQNVGVHQAYLSREFRRHFGSSMGEYLRRLRIEAARDEISKSTIQLSELALKYGFYDQSHFTNTFKQLVGMTPAQYKAAFKAS